MGAPRRTAQHAEAVEMHGTRVRRLIVHLNSARADGVIDPAENTQLDRLTAAVLTSLRPLPAQASLIDSGVRTVSALLNTMSVTTWTARLIRETEEDEERLTALEGMAVTDLVLDQAA